MPEINVTREGTMPELTISREGATQLVHNFAANGELNRMEALALVALIYSYPTEQVAIASIMEDFARVVGK
jgi:hypothetical protein